MGMEEGKMGGDDGRNASNQAESEACAGQTGRISCRLVPRLSPVAFTSCSCSSCTASSFAPSLRYTAFRLAIRKYDIIACPTSTSRHTRDRRSHGYDAGVRLSLPI